MIRKQNQQSFFKNPIHRVSFRLQNQNAVTYFLAICKRYDWKINRITIVVVKLFSGL